MNVPKPSLVLIALLIAKAARAEPVAGPPASRALAPPQAAWEATSPREIAHQHFNRGVELAGKGEYEQALAEFSSAYQSFPHFAVLYNIGQAYILLGRPIAAVDNLERYLRDGKEQIPPDRVERTVQQIAAQRTLTAELRVVVNVHSAVIELDGRPVGSAPLIEPLRVDPGTHLLSVRAPDRPPLLRSITLSPGQVLDVALELPSAPMLVAPSAPTPAALQQSPAPLALPPDRPPQPAPRPEISVPDPRLRVLGYVLGGVGVALGGSALGHYLWNRHRYERWQSEHEALKAERVDGSYDDRQKANNRLSASIDGAESVTLALAFSAGACLTSGTVLFMLNAEASAPSSSAGGVQVSMRGVW